MNASASPVMPALGPYDRFFLASSLALMQKGLPGHHVFVRLCLSGRLDLNLLRARLTQTLKRHPVLTAGIACTRLTRQPYWVAGTDHPSGDESVSSLPLEEIMLTGSPDPEAKRDAMLQCAAQERQAPSPGPLLRLWVFHFGEDRHDLVLRWPHYLMDLTGAESFLAEIAAECAGPVHRGTAAASPGFFRSVAAWCRGMWWLRQVNFLKGNRLKAVSTGDPVRFETLHHAWTEAQSASIDAAARESCKSGPLLHTRWHIASVVRAVDAVFARADTHRRDHYLISLPQRREPAGRAAIAGNDLTIATLVLHRGALDGPHAVDDALALQLAARADRRRGEADEMTTAFPGRFPLPLYVWLLRRFRIFPRYSIGFTSNRAADWTDGFLGCRVEDVAVWGVPPSPPGIIASFCRFRSRLSLSLGYFTNVCSPATAAEILRELEQRLGVPAGDGPLAESGR